MKKNEKVKNKKNTENTIEKNSKFKKILDKLKKFFNNPVPIIIALVALNAFLLLYISRYDDKNKIYVGLIDKVDIAVVNIHYFTNGDMNYFYASNAAYLAEDKDIYSFEIGYYVKNSAGEFIPLAVRSRHLDGKTSLAKVVSEMSGWNFAEPDRSDNFFSDEVMNNLDKLYFRVLATTTKEGTKSDVYIEYEVEVTKVTR